MRPAAPFAKMNGLGNEIIVADMRGRADRVAPAAARRAQQPSRRPASTRSWRSIDPRTPGTDDFVDIFNTDGSSARRLRQRHALRRPAMVGARRHRMRSPSRRPPACSTAEKRADALISPSTWASRASAGSEIPLAEEFGDTRCIELQIGADRRAGPAFALGASAWAIRTRSSGSRTCGRYDLDRIGPLLENHPMFPERANISHRAGHGRATRSSMRTWERGAGLTRACGSAACAAAVAAARTAQDRAQRRP